jgi:hypothetical protein
MSDIDNPWREFIENCINGSNYFRASEYRDLLADLDRGYAAEAENESLRSRLAAAEEKLHRIRRMGELSAAIMRDPERTGGWSGSERVARGFERIAHLAGEKHE